MTKKSKREYRPRNPFAKELAEGRTGAFKLRRIHPKKYEKPKRITMADIRKGILDEDR